MLQLPQRLRLDLPAALPSKISHTFHLFEQPVSPVITRASMASTVIAPQFNAGSIT